MSKKKISWLHLSDLHAFSKRDEWDSHKITSTLVDDLKSLNQEYGIRPDFLFFTGDLAFGQVGNKDGERIVDQFVEGRKFLEQVQRVYNPPIQNRDVYLVPGNHDVNRSMVDEMQTSWLRDSVRKEEEITTLINKKGITWDRILERLDEYRNFLRVNKFDHLLTDSERLIFADIREVDGIRIGIAGFNTAWSCCQNREKGDLWAGSRFQLGHLSKSITNVDFKIALLHHPPNWLNEFEDSKFKRDLSTEFEFVLHGHEHSEWVDPNASGHVAIAAGTVYESSTRPASYNLSLIHISEPTRPY